MFQEREDMLRCLRLSLLLLILVPPASPSPLLSLPQSGPDYPEGAGGERPATPGRGTDLPTDGAHYLVLYSWARNNAECAKGIPCRDRFADVGGDWSPVNRADSAHDRVYFVRNEGLVFDPHYPQPAGTVALRSFWRAGFPQDELLTTAWSEKDHDPAYRPQSRVLGYVYRSHRTHTLPLYHWTKEGRDHFVTTDPAWAPGTRHGSRDRFVAIEGYLLPAGH
jgi:hypothetical protein